MTGSIAPRHVEAIDRYRPGTSIPGFTNGKLSSNEAPLGPSPGAIRAIARSAPAAGRYRVADSLRRRLASEEGVDEEQAVVTNGSDELCYLVAALFIRPGAPVVLADPPYQINEIASRLQDGALRFVPLRDGAHDLEAMTRAATGASVLWLPNPHNPTGTVVSHAALRELMRVVPDDCVVVLDEAYRPYADPGLLPDVGELLALHQNLLIQRTLSKAHALAGLRVGFALGGAELIAAIERVRPPFNVNSAAIAAAEQALDDVAWSRYAVAATRRERDRFAAFLSELGVAFFPSQANFITVRPSEPALVRDRLAACGISVRDGGELGLEGWLRVSIGSPPAMALVRAVLRDAEGPGA